MLSMKLPYVGLRQLGIPSSPNVRFGWKADIRSVRTGVGSYPDGLVDLRRHFARPLDRNTNAKDDSHAEDASIDGRNRCYPWNGSLREGRRYRQYLRYDQAAGRAVVEGLCRQGRQRN